MKDNAFESVKLSLNTHLKTRSSRDEGDQVREILQVRAQFYRSFYAILHKPVERFSINETDDEFSMEEKSLFVISKIISQKDIGCSLAPRFLSHLFRDPFSSRETDDARINRK